MILPLPQHIQINENKTWPIGHTVNLDYIEDKINPKCFTLFKQVLENNNIKITINSKEPADTNINIFSLEYAAIIKNNVEESRNNEEFYMIETLYHKDVPTPPQFINLQFNTEEGIFRALSTIICLINHYGFELPYFNIVDYPNLKRRGLYYDVSRGKIPTVDTLKFIIDYLAIHKYNVFSLYFEHPFDFKSHPEINKNEDVLTAKEIIEIDHYCQDRFIDFIPSLQSLGHMKKILNTKEYNHLSERPAAPWCISPALDETYTFLDSLYQDFLPNFSSKYFNICCDETYDLGIGQSKEICKENGTINVYLEHILKLKEIIEQKHDKKIMIWADILLNHIDEIEPEKLKDISVLNWYYEANWNFDERINQLNGTDQWICPGTSAWNAVFPRFNNTMQNITNFIEAAMKNNVEKMLLTDWGDCGHTNLLANSLYQYSYAGSLAWNTSTELEDFNKVYTQQIYQHYNHETLLEFYVKTGNFDLLLTNNNPIFNNSILFEASFLNLNLLKKHITMPCEELMAATQSLVFFYEQKVESLFKEILEVTKKSIFSSFISNWEENIMLNISELHLGFLRTVYALNNILLCIYPKEVIEQDSPEYLIEKMQVNIKLLNNIIEEFQSLWLLRNKPSYLSSNLKKMKSTKDYYLSIIEFLTENKIEEEL